MSIAIRARGAFAAWLIFCFCGLEAGAEPIPPAPPESTAAVPARNPPDERPYAGLEAFEATMPSWFPKLLGAQTTAVNQRQLPFHSLYSGQQSLNQNGQDTTTWTRSAFFGARVTESLSLYLDVDWFFGQGLHTGSGAAGYPNGEVIRAGSINLARTPYTARFYSQYVVPLSADTVDVERGMDQLPGRRPVEYAIFKAGLMSSSDDFDNNRYANSARTQFLNFSLINNGAWDYAADTRGYSWGLMAGLVRSDWSIKFGRYALPKAANGKRFDTKFAEDHGDNVEFAVKPFANDTVLRFLAYENRGRMGRFSTVVQQARATGSIPDVVTDNSPGHVRYGFGVNAELPVADAGETGLFFRAGWSDGRTANFAFTDIDRAVGAGAQVSGRHWGRDDDWIGVGLAANFLSPPHRAFFAAGGIGILIGDGALVHYQPEQIAEIYYNYRLLESVRISPDYQFIRNPGYNADRGPVHIFGLRARASM